MTASGTLHPDLSEARRLLGAGMQLVEMVPLTKRPIGDDWNHRPVTVINPDATGYGLLLGANKLCSVDPDHRDAAIVGMRALGFDLIEMMRQGVLTTSTRENSGGRSSFAVDGEIAWLKFSCERFGTVLELRADSPNLQDTIPGIVYRDKDGNLCTQRYANCRRLDDAPALPDEFLAWWERCSTDVEYFRKQQDIFFAGIAQHFGETLERVKPHRAISSGKQGGPLAFAAPGIRGDFNRKTPVADILTRHGYVYHRDLDRWSCPTASGAPGIRPIPGKDGLWRSDHASDPLHGCFDAWTACVVLDHGGDLDAALRALAGTDQPPDDDRFPSIDTLVASEPRTPRFDDPDRGKARDETADVSRDENPLLPRRPLDWTNLTGREPEPREWAVQDWLPMGNAALLAGRGGIGKTLLAQTIGTCLALNLNYFADTSKPRRVLMWAGEDDHDELWRRQLAICQWAGVGIEDLHDKLIVHSYHGHDLTLAGIAFGQFSQTALMEELREQVLDYRADYIFLDNIARIFGGNENDRHQVTTFVSWITAACGKAGVCLLGHPGKAQGAEYSGSTAWEGSVRARLYLGEQLPDAKHDADDVDDPGDDTVRYLARRKANYSAKDFVRLEYRQGVLMACQQPETPFGAPSAEYALDVVVRAVRKLDDLGMVCTASTRSDDYLPKLAKRYDLLDRVTDRQFTTAMRKLIVSKRLITVEVGKYANRNPRMGLRLAP